MTNYEFKTDVRTQGLSQMSKATFSVPRIAIWTAIIVGLILAIGTVIGWNLDGLRPNLERQLYWGIAEGEFEQVEDLILTHPELSNRDIFSGDRALHVAAENNRPEMIALLVRNGADVNLKNKFGYTPLHVAAESGSVECINELIAHGAEVDSVAFQEKYLPVFWITPLGCAYQRYEIGAAEALFKGGATATVPQGAAVAPLHLACFRPNEPTTLDGARQLVALWKENGGDLEIRTAQGQSPIELAQESKCSAMETALREQLN